MKNDEMKSESITFQWDFYERAINNYSIIMRILNYFEEEDSLITRIPKVFVEESIFDMCKIVKSDNGVIAEGFFSIEDTANNLDIERIIALNEGAISPSLMKDVLGYSVLYVYPLKEEMKIFGFLLLGKKGSVDLEARLLRELEIVCDIYNKALLLHIRARTQKQERDIKPLYENALNTFPDAMLLIDKNGFVCFANKRAKTEFESAKGFLIGEKIDNIVSGITEDFYRKDRPQYGEVNYKTGDKYKAFNINTYPIKEKREKGAYKGVVFKDVVENKIRQEEHVLREKMESIGMLAGGIAHDFNNLLTGVLGYASLIKNFVSHEQKLYRYAEAIEHSAQRAAKLTQHLLNFSRRQRKKTGIVDLNMLLEDILFLIKESFRDVEIQKTFHDLLPPIRGDEAELQNVFLNLCVNARDAMDGVGLIRVKTERKRYIGGREFAYVEIEDTGKGMDESTKEKIFEPYFTTKEGGKNLGMGLYLVDKIIREHGGFIEFESETGKGTRFCLYLPLPIETIVERTAKEEIARQVDVAKQKVLVVDDEDVIREFLKGVLTDEGIEILEAADGTQGIQIFTEHKDEIDLVILDIIMPGIKGDEVLKAMREIRKEIKVIISSGFMSEDQRERLKKYGVDGFLDKPFRDKDVIRTIIEVLSKK
jgi:nitrogen-specific signal transduction histidine kinase/ActR/RegA family two-component response regulator